MPKAITFIPGLNPPQWWRPLARLKFRKHFGGHRNKVIDCFYKLGTVEKITKVEYLTDHKIGDYTPMSGTRITAEVTPFPDEAIRWYRKDEAKNFLMGRNFADTASYHVHRYCERTNEGWWQANLTGSYSDKEILYHGPSRDAAIEACERHHRVAVSGSLA